MVREKHLHKLQLIAAEEVEGICRFLRPGRQCAQLVHERTVGPLGCFRPHIEQLSGASEHVEKFLRSPEQISTVAGESGI